MSVERIFRNNVRKAALAYVKLTKYPIKWSNIRTKMTFNGGISHGYLYKLLDVCCTWKNIDLQAYIQ